MMSARSVKGQSVAVKWLLSLLALILVGLGGWSSKTIVDVVSRVTAIEVVHENIDKRMERMEKKLDVILEMDKKIDKLLEDRK